MKKEAIHQNLSVSRYRVGLKSSSGGLAIVLAGSLLSSSQVDAAVHLINDSFDGVGGTTSLSNNGRIRTNQANGNFWVKDSSSDWSIGGGVLSNSAAGGVNSVPTEGAISQVIDTSAFATDLTNLTLSFDYTVGATATLKFALIGYTANLQTGQSGTDTLLMNNGTANGALQNDTQAELRQGDINLFTGADMTQSITNDLTFAAGTSGFYSGSFDLSSYAWHADEPAGFNGNSPGLSGSIMSIADFDRVVLVAVNDLSAGTATVTTLDNIILTSTVPEPSSTALLGLGVGFFVLRRRRA